METTGKQGVFSFPQWPPCPCVLGCEEGTTRKPDLGRGGGRHPVSLQLLSLSPSQPSLLLHLLSLSLLPSPSPSFSSPPFLFPSHVPWEAVPADFRAGCVLHGIRAGQKPRPVQFHSRWKRKRTMESWWRTRRPLAHSTGHCVSFGHTHGSIVKGAGAGVRGSQPGSGRCVGCRRELVWYPVGTARWA